jgi:hypothetical protein
MILDRLDLDTEAFATQTGWQVKPEGACRGHVCVPLPSGPLDVAVLAGRLGMSLVHDEVHGMWAVGPASVTGRALVDAEAPDLTLPDVDGNPFSLSSLRGQKVVLVAWASW